jgi:hypothetical protein
LTNEGLQAIFSFAVFNITLFAKEPDILIGQLSSVIRHSTLVRLGRLRHSKGGVYAHTIHFSVHGITV